MVAFMTQGRGVRSGPASRPASWISAGPRLRCGVSRGGGTPFPGNRLWNFTDFVLAFWEVGFDSGRRSGLFLNPTLGGLAARNDEGALSLDGSTTDAGNDETVPSAT